MRAPSVADVVESTPRLPVTGLLGRLIRAGTERYPAETRRRLELTNAFSYLVVITAMGFGIGFAIADFERYRLIVLLNVIHVILGVAIPLLHRFSDVAAGLVLTLVLDATMFALVWQTGRGAGTQLNYLVAAVIPFVTFGLTHLRLAVMVAVVSHGLHLAAWMAFPPEDAALSLSQQVLDYLYAAAATTAFVVSAIIVFDAQRRAARAEAATEALLNNTLPAPIVARLRDRQTASIADHVESASVLFADIVGFTPLTRTLGPERIVAVLDEAFSAFDRLAERHGVEKIKTIGDSYMAAGGLPEPVDDHAVRLVAFGLAMLDSIRELASRFDVDLDLRVGVASGPLTAGVIGRSRFLYDVWGDTVNLASRLESGGVPGRVHVSDGVRAAAAGAFEFEERGVVELKGIGPVHSWLVVRATR